MKRNIALAYALLFSLIVNAQTDCPKGYDQIFVLCNKKEVAKCIVPAKQPECDYCWEIHYAPCEGRTSGGMHSFSTYQAAASYAAADKLIHSTSCPWYDNQVYRIVYNNPSECLQKPTGNEMVSTTYTKQGTGDVDDLLNELLNDESVIANDTNTKKEWEQVKKDTKETLAKKEPEKSSTGNYSGTQSVGLRGLAGKIESGEYDPYAPKTNTTSNSNAANGNTTTTATGTNAGNQAGNTSNQNSYVVFWIRTGTFNMTPQLKMKLNGQYVEGYIFGAEDSPPSCSYQNPTGEDAYGKVYGTALRVPLSKTQNSWAAEELHNNGDSKKWYGTFTAQPGCNIIEVR